MFSVFVIDYKILTNHIEGKQKNPIAWLLMPQSVEQQLKTETLHLVFKLVNQEFASSNKRKCRQTASKQQMKM